MNDISSIRDYILYLKKNCGLYITLHPLKYDKLIFPTELISFNIHDNPYCIYLKTCPTAQQHCIEKQGKVVAKCLDGPYNGVCYAGVKERIYPISDGEEVIGFISVSGYKTENYKSYLSAVSEKYGLNYEKTESTYYFLKDYMPSSQELDTLVKPLCAMLELGYLKSNSTSEKEQKLYRQMENYIRKYHNGPITVDDLCRQFGCSRSFISHNFKENVGLSIKNYINALRIDDAKSLLVNSDLSVTEIAMATGFNDSNYFSVVFKENVGLSPMAYRKNPPK